jgi:hypothetical protein
MSLQSALEGADLCKKVQEVKFVQPHLCAAAVELAAAREGALAHLLLRARPWFQSLVLPVRGPGTATGGDAHES